MRVAIVSFEPSIERHAADPELPGPVLVDPDRALCQANGMDRAGWLDVWGPRSWWAYGRALAGGARVEVSRADTRQRGGDVLVDPDGVVRLHGVGRRPADRPEIEALLAVVRRGSALRSW